jgi:hypothetical protein
MPMVMITRCFDALTSRSVYEKSLRLEGVACRVHVALRKRR